MLGSEHEMRFFVICSTSRILFSFTMTSCFPPCQPIFVVPCTIWTGDALCVSTSPTTLNDGICSFRCRSFVHSLLEKKSSLFRDACAPFLSIFVDDPVCPCASLRVSLLFCLPFLTHYCVVKKVSLLFHFLWLKVDESDLS